MKGYVVLICSAGRFMFLYSRIFYSENDALAAQAAADKDGFEVCGVREFEVPLDEGEE